jgi:crossover junction endodeoxyribonuclease RuvC
MPNKYFFGLDLSLNSTGISVFTTNDMQFVEVFTIAIDKDFAKTAKTQNKLKNIGKELLKYRKEYKPEFIVIEKAFMRYIKSTAQLMRVHGVVNYLFSDIPQYEIAATTVKLKLAGVGNADKSQVAKAVSTMYPEIFFKNEDESDACAVAISHAINMGWIKN